jgi:hypothetical protein
MRTVEILSGQGPFFGPVVDLELPENQDITSVNVTVRTMFGEGTVTLLETDWDHADTWQPMSSKVIGQHSEETVVALVNRDSHELVRWLLSGYGAGPYWVLFDAQEGNEK